MTSWCSTIVPFLAIVYRSAVWNDNTLPVEGIPGVNTNGPSWVPVVFVNTNTLSPSDIILFIVILKSGNAV